jgi:hypothetical protein
MRSSSLVWTFEFQTQFIPAPHDRGRNTTQRDSIQQVQYWSLWRLTTTTRRLIQDPGQDHHGEQGDIHNAVLETHLRDMQFLLHQGVSRRHDERAPKDSEYYHFGNWCLRSRWCQQPSTCAISSRLSDWRDSPKVTALELVDFGLDFRASWDGGLDIVLCDLFANNNSWKDLVSD